MTIISRDYNFQTDFSATMKFLREVYKRTNTIQNWFPDRFENCNINVIKGVRIWEEIDNASIPRVKKILGLVVPEVPLDYYILIDPEYTHIESEMIHWVEKYCAENKKNQNKNYVSKIHNIEGNEFRDKLLKDFKYNKVKIYGYLRFRSVDHPLQQGSCAEGFTIRSVNPESDFEDLAATIRLVFGHGAFFTAEILQKISRSSFYIKELDLIAESPDGTIASFCTFRMDPISRITSLEPMGTNPRFRKLGLAKSLMIEGMRRAMKYNPSLFVISGAANNPAANRLYDSVGFTQKFAEFLWQKEI